MPSRRRPFLAVVTRALAVGLVGVAATSVAASPAAADPGTGSRVVSGTATRIESFPSTVRLSSFGDAGGFCGGTLIAPNKVATAQHCVVGKRPGNVYVTIGRTDWAGDRAGEIIQVRSIRLMSGYTFPKNDAAVLTLSRASTGQVARLATSNSPSITSGNAATVVGWGRTATGAEQSPTLLRAGLSLRSDAECNYTGYDDASNLCASAPSSTQNNAPCNGDSGGPLYTTGADRRLELLGVVSGVDANGCESTVGPSFYADAATGPVHDFLAADAVFSAKQFAGYRSNVVAYNVAGGVRTVRIDNTATTTVLASGGELQSPHAFVASGTTVLLRNTAGDGNQVFVENVRTHAVTPSFSPSSPGSVGYSGHNVAYTYANAGGGREFTVFGSSFSAPGFIGVAAPERPARVAYGFRAVEGAHQVNLFDTAASTATSIALPDGWDVTDIAFQPGLNLLISMTNRAAGNGETYECTPVLTTVFGQSQPLTECTLVLQTTTAARIATFERGSQALLAYTQGTALNLLDRNTGISRRLATGVVPGSAIAVGPKV